MTSSVKFSIVVPVFDQWALVPDLLTCMERQSLEPARFEILLVDNGSRQLNPPRRLPPGTRILHCAQPGSYAARNHGADAARGAWLVFTDADCLPAAGWLRAFDAATGRPGAERSVLAGEVAMLPSGSSPTAYEIFDLVRGMPQDRNVERGYATTANLAVPGTLFRHLGGFDDRLYSGGDVDFCRRSRRAGYRLTFVPAAKIEHRARTTWRAVATKARRIKGGQLTGAFRGSRASTAIRTFLPPAIGIGRLALAADYSLRFRLIAILVRLRIWVAEMGAVIRHAIYGEAERR